MGKKDFTIGRESFPSVSALNSEKLGKPFGNMVGKAIQSEWFLNSGNGSRYYGNCNEFKELKLYARGEQPVGKYKKLMAVNGDLSHTNVDFTIVPIIPKFVDVIVNGMTDREFAVKAEAQDKLSNEKRSAFVKSMEKDMRNKDFLLQAQAQLGVNGFENDYDKVPDTPEELEVLMELNYKQSIEVVQEISIKALMDKNDYTTIRRRFNYDLVTLGIGAVKHEFDPRSGANVRYVDPENLVYSYSESPNFDDCYYFGEVKREPITELQRRWNLSATQVKEIEANSNEWNNYHRIKNDKDSALPNHIANVLYFSYKTSMESQVWKKKLGKDGEEIFLEKDLDWNPPVEKLRGSERVSSIDEVWFEGAMILGTDIMLDWRMEDYSLRPKSNHNKALPKYVVCAPRMYDGRIESITRRMIPFGDAIQMNHLKLQHVTSRIIPDGIYLDVDGLVEIDLGNGKKYNPAEAYKMFMQTGSVIGRSNNTMGALNHGSVPVKEINTNSSHNKIRSLIEQYDFQLNRLRDVTGINEVVDGSTPDKKMLVGVSEMAVSNSNTATKHIMDASTYGITRRLAEGLSYRVVDIVRNPATKEQFMNEIGKNNVKILEELNVIHLHDFGINIELSPDAFEKASIERDINLALTNGTISIEDASIVRDVKNYKTAVRYLGVKIRKREEDIHLKKQQLITVQSQENIKLKQAELELIRERAKAESDGKIASIRVEGEEKRLNTSHEAKEKLRLMQEELSINMALQGDLEAKQEQREKYREDRKDQRQSKGNTEASKIANQKQTGGPPVDFESNEDSLDGFSLGSFEPR